MFKLIASAFLLALIISSCEGYRCGKGIVKDKATNTPIDSVLCTAISGNDQVYTDTSGNFSVCNQISGCAPECKDIIVEFSKPGYITIRVENPNDDIIYLER